MSGCPGLETLEQGGPVVEAHLRRCDTCRAIRALLSIEADRPAAPSTVPLADPVREPEVDCARAELLIAASAAGPLDTAEAAFLSAHLAGCRGCLQAGLEPLAANGTAPLPVVPPIHYVLGAEIGRGGMGRIIAARDLRTGRTVALKEMLATRPGARERFEREARITARLQHPGIVSIYEVGQWPDGRPFYAMPILTGRTLAASIAAAAGLRQRLQLLPGLIAAADAIAYAHSRQVIHRDLTPANILLGEFGETVVIDWGVARQLDAEPTDADPDAPSRAAPAMDVARDRGLTALGTVVGTPAYMAPEQADGQPVDERADVYALGAILHHLLTGRSPYAGHGSHTVITWLRARRPASNAATGRIPRDLASVARKAMDAAPERRYDSAAGFVAELRRFQAGQRLQAHRYSLRELAQRWLSRRMVPVAASALVLAIVAAGAAAAGLKVARERNRAEVITTALLTEQGRQELAAGAPSRALVYLREAHRRGDDSAALRLLLASALRSIEARGPTFQSPSFPNDLAFSPDGHYLATAVVGAVVGVAVHDVATWRQIRLVSDERFAFGRAAFSQDGAYLATWGGAGKVDTGVTLWDTRSWSPARVLAGGRVVTEVQLSTDGKLLLATADDSQGVELYELPSGRRRLAIGPRPGGDQLWGYLFADGRHFATFGDRDTPAIRELATGKVLRTFDGVGHGVRSLDVSADGRRVLLAGATGARLWDASAGRVIADLGGTGPVHSARFSADGSRVLVVARDDQARLFDSDSGRPVASLGSVEWNIRGGRAVFAGDGVRLVTTASNGLRVWLAHTGTRLEALDETGPIATMAVSPDGRWMATGTFTGQVQRWDLSRSVLRAGVPRPERDNAPLGAGTRLAGSRVLAVSADRRAVLVLPDSEPPRPELRDAITLALKLRLPPQGNLRLIAPTPDGEGILTSDATGHVALYRAPDGRKVTFSGFSQGLLNHAFSPDGSRLYLQETGTGRSGLWDPRDGKLVALLEPNEARAPLFSPDGALLILWGEEAAVWNASDGRFLYNVSDFLPLLSAGFSADSRYLYLLSSELGVIEARTGRLLLSKSDAPQLTDAAFAPDSSLLLLASREGTDVLDWRTRRVLLRLAGDGVSEDRTAYWLGAMVAAWKGERPALLEIDPADQTAILNHHNNRVYLWDLSLESRSPAEIDRLLAGHPSPWRLEGGQLVRVPDDPGDAPGTPLPAPHNLDFELGAAGAAPASWLVTGGSFSAGTIVRRAGAGRRAAVLVGQPVGLARGTMGQLVDATPYRGQPVRLRAAVRCERGLPAALLLRTQRPTAVTGLDARVLPPSMCTGQWQDVSVTGNVDADAVTIELGVTLETAGEVAIDEVRLERLRPE